MDRRQRKTREAIFSAFTRLLSQKDYHQITVGQIIALADVGRATFYAHFEAKECLLEAFCQELFCHIFDAEWGVGQTHRHIFHCHDAAPVFLHLFRHLQSNDNQILTLLRSRNNELFLSYFRANMTGLVKGHLPVLEEKRKAGVPDSFWENHVTATLVETVKWWIDRGMQESPELMAEYFLAVL